MAIRTLDLFHGAGGSSLGAKFAGAEIVGGVDYWNIACECYTMNFPKARSVNADVRNVSPKLLHKIIGDIDLILASPECTNHSCARGARARCEESRLTAFQVIRFAREFRSKWIILENVIQMKSWRRHSELLTEITKLGYHVQEVKVDAQDLGVPQSRKRLFLLCSLLREVDYVNPACDEFRSAKTIINSNGGYGFTPLFLPKRAKATIERAERAISALGPREPFLIVYYGTDGSGGWQSLDNPLRTVTTLDRFAYVKPTPTGHVMRMLQPEELKLAMGFPKDFILKSGTRRDKVKLMGNAVCPPVMEFIVRTITQPH